MRYDSTARLEHLASIRDAKRHAALKLSDEQRRLSERKGRLNEERHRIERDFGIPRDAFDRRVEEIEAELSRLDTKAERLRERYRQADAEAKTSGRTLSAAVEFARQHGLPMPEGVQ